MNKIKTGDRFGKLVVVADSGQRYRKHIIFECLCECGKTHYAISMHLTSGSTKSCGCAQHQRGVKRKRTKMYILKATLAKIGTKIHKLTAIYFKKELDIPLKVILRCDCGNVVIRQSEEFFKGNIKSCGCISKERSRRAREKEAEHQFKMQLERERRHEYIPAEDYTGKRFGKLTVLYLCGVRIINKYKDRMPLWYCQCECGGFAVKSSAELKQPDVACLCKPKPKPTKASIKKRVRSYKATRRKKLLSLGLSPNYKVSNHRQRSDILRKVIFDKYEHTCVRCGTIDSKDNPLHVHHYRSYSKHPELRFLVANNILLCEECHDNLHKKLGFIDPPITEQRRYILNIGA